MLTPELVTETTAAYSKVVAGKPIDILVKGAEGNARLRAARLNLERAMTTKKYPCEPAAGASILRGRVLEGQRHPQ
jgi:hypothetical protein